MQPLPLPPVAARRARGPATPRRPAGATERRAAPKRPSLLRLVLAAAAAPPVRAATRRRATGASVRPRPEARRERCGADLAPPDRAEPRAISPAPQLPTRAGAALPPAAPVAPPPTEPRPARAVAPPAGRAEPRPRRRMRRVYKSGVIDGMAYTLFMDGAIEAELPQGRSSSRSIDELQTYLTTRQSATLRRLALRRRRSRRHRPARPPSAGRTGRPRRRGPLPCWCGARSDCRRCSALRSFATHFAGSQ